MRRSSWRIAIASIIFCITGLNPTVGFADEISVNGTSAIDADFNDTTPAEPADAVNLMWQLDPNTTPYSISAYLPLNAMLDANGSASNFSGLELADDGLALLQDCDATNNILKWNDSSGKWECKPDDDSSTLDQITDQSGDKKFVIGINEELEFEIVSISDNNLFVIKNEPLLTPDGVLFNVRNVHGSGLGQELAVFERTASGEKITISGGVDMTPTGGATITATDLTGFVDIADGSGIDLSAVSPSEQDEGLILPQTTICGAGTQHKEGAVCYGTVNDEFCIWDNNVNGWDCLDMDTGGTFQWTRSGDNVRPLNKEDEVIVGDTVPQNGAKFSVVAEDTTQIGMVVQNPSGSSKDIARFKVGSSKKVIIDVNGRLHVQNGEDGGLSTVNETGDLYIGNTDTDAVFILTDANGDGELTVPNQSISATEILNETILSADIKNGTITLADLGTTAKMRTVCKTLEAPVDADDNIVIFQFETASTITAMSCDRDSGTRLDLNLYEAAATDVLVNAIVDCDATDVDTAWDTAMSNPNMAAGSKLEWHTITSTGSPKWGTLCFRYYEN